MRLGVFALAALLVLRAIVVLVVNHGRLDEDKLEGMAIHGRYYPVERVCLAVDDSTLEEGLAGSRLDRGGFTLLASGNGFALHDDEGYVVISCGWRNWEYDKDPQVFFEFTAAILATKKAPRPECETTTSLGGYAACRENDGFETTLRLADDNLKLTCQVKSQDEKLQPALEKAMRTACEDFADRLARSRPVTYWGNAFWTVR